MATCVSLCLNFFVCIILIIIEAVNRRTDITMAKTQRTKGQIMIYKTFQTTDWTIRTPQKPRVNSCVISCSTEASVVLHSFFLCVNCQRYTARWQTKRTF